MKGVGAKERSTESERLSSNLHIYTEYKHESQAARWLLRPSRHAMLLRVFLL